MTSAMVSDIAQTPLSVSNTKPDSPSQDDKGSNTLTVNASAALTKDGKTPPGDTVSISDQSRQAVADGKKEEAKATLVNKSGKPGTPTATVQFVYDPNGELIVRHMDADNRLIYQVPSKLMLRMRELAKPHATVDMKA